MKTKQDKSHLTLGEMFDDTIKSRWAGKAREAVEWKQAQKIEALLGRERRVETLTAKDVDYLVETWKADGNKPATINSKLSTLTTALNHTRRRGKHTLDLHVDKMRHPSNARIRFFSSEQVECIKGYLAHPYPEFGYFFTFLLETGMRPGEARAIRLSDIRTDPELGEIVDVIKTKNGDPRCIPLTSAARNAVGCMTYPGSGLFSKFTPSVIARVWREVRKHCNLGEDYVLYTTRHTCATRLLSKGVNIKVAQAWLGHKDINQTLRYAKLVPADLAAARDLLEEAPRH
ncbi:MAG: hypothetical protein CMM47_01730 [Rhodospirillaceae bacterium]|nr:hypothetical protein [Rhodospirillaceae bacterium]